MIQPEIAPITKTLTQAAISAYAEASGDHNPIHVDEAYAKTTPLGGTIAHGMMTLAALSEMMTAAFGRAWLESGQLDARFRNPARPGDAVTARSAPAGASGNLLKYSVEVVNQRDEVLISGTATLEVRDASVG
jgi:3-hydroxybutyryl-CoA dehydratase